MGEPSAKDLYCAEAEKPQFKPFFANHCTNVLQGCKLAHTRCIPKESTQPEPVPEVPSASQECYEGEFWDGQACLSCNVYYPHGCQWLNTSPAGQGAVDNCNACGAS